MFPVRKTLSSALSALRKPSHKLQQPVVDDEEAMSPSQVLAQTARSLQYLDFIMADLDARKMIEETLFPQLSLPTTIALSLYGAVTEWQQFAETSDGLVDSIQLAHKIVALYVMPDCQFYIDLPESISLPLVQWVAESTSSPPPSNLFDATKIHLIQVIEQDPIALQYLAKEIVAIRRSPVRLLTNQTRRADIISIANLYGISSTPFELLGALLDVKEEKETRNKILKLVEVVATFLTEGSIKYWGDQLPLHVKEGLKSQCEDTRTLSKRARDSVMAAIKHITTYISTNEAMNNLCDDETKEKMAKSYLQSISGRGREE